MVKCHDIFLPRGERTCEDCAEGKYGPTHVAWKVLDPDQPDWRPLLRALVDEYREQLISEAAQIAATHVRGAA